MVVGALNRSNNNHYFVRARLLGIFFLIMQALGSGYPETAFPASKARIVVPDVLALPGEEVFLEAYLYRSSLMSLVKPGIQGELLQYLDEKDNLLRALLTDPSGVARIRYQAGPPGRYQFSVRLAQNPRYTAAAETGTLTVRPPDIPLFFVMIEGGLMPQTPLPLMGRALKETIPYLDSAEKLRQLIPCCTIVYLSLSSKLHPQPMRLWLEQGGYPKAPLLFLERPLSVELTPDSVPDLSPVRPLWKDRTHPVYLVTGIPAAGESAAREGVRVFLLREKDEEDPYPSEEEFREDGISLVQGWAEVPALCSQNP